MKTVNQFSPVNPPSLSHLAKVELAQTVGVLVEVKNLIAVGEIDEAYNMLDNLLKESNEEVH